MKFKSKIDRWFHVTVLLLLAVTVLLVGLYIRDRAGMLLVCSVIFLLVDALLVLPIYFFTFYTLEDAALYIRCGLYRKRIAYTDIRTIRETRDPSASVGLSLDRILILYANGELFISPRNKQAFIGLIQQRIV